MTTLVFVDVSIMAHLLDREGVRLYLELLGAAPNGVIFLLTFWHAILNDAEIPKAVLSIFQKQASNLSVCMSQIQTRYLPTF